MEGICFLGQALNQKMNIMGREQKGEWVNVGFVVNVWWWSMPGLCPASVVMMIASDFCFDRLMDGQSIRSAPFLSPPLLKSPPGFCHDLPMMGLGLPRGGGGMWP